MDRLDKFMLTAQLVTALAATYWLFRTARREDRPLNVFEKTLIVLLALLFAFSLWDTLDPV